MSGPAIGAHAPAGASALVVSLLLGLLVAVFIAWPLAHLVVQALTPGPQGAGGIFDSYREAFTSPVAASAIWGTAWLTVTSLCFGIPLALLLAWITSSTDAPLARRLGMLPTLTLALSPLVGAIGWLILLTPRIGIVNVAIRSLTGSSADTGPLDAYSLPMIVMLMSFYVVPYIYGPAYAAFSRIDASLGEAAHACGASVWDTLWTVTLPVLRPAILAGALIGGVMSASMFAIPLILASGTGLHVIPTEIYHYINQEGRFGPATAMASLLSAVTVTAMLLYFRLLGRGRFVTVSGKGSRRARTRLGIWRWPATLLVLAFLFLAMIAPLLALAHLSLVDIWSSDTFRQALSFEQYRKLADFPSALPGLWNSGWLAAAGASLALALGALVSYRRVRSPTRENRALAFFSSLPLGIPAIVLGLAFLQAFTGGWLPLYGTAFALIAAYAIHVLPMAMRNADAGLLQVAPELEESALVCGDSRAGVIGRIVAPLLRQPLVTAWGLTFIILFRDISISILLYTSDHTPSSVVTLAMFDQGWMPGTAAYSIIITLISAAVVAAMLRSHSPADEA